MGLLLLVLPGMALLTMQQHRTHQTLPATAVILQHPSSSSSCVNASKQPPRQHKPDSARWRLRLRQRATQRWRLRRQRQLVVACGSRPMSRGCDCGTLRRGIVCL